MWFLFAVDEEFEVVATQVLSRTHAMVNKYRRLLMVEAEVGTHTSNWLHAYMCFMYVFQQVASPFTIAFQSIVRNGDD